MFSLQTLMAMDGKQVLKLALIIGAALLAVAFVIGMVKGFRKVSKVGFLWLTAGVAFCIVYKMVGEKNLLSGVFKGKLASFADITWAFLLVVACIVITLVLSAAVAVLFRPIPDDRLQSNKKNRSKDGEEEYPVAQMAKMERDDLKPTPKPADSYDLGYIPAPRYKKLSIWGRIFGGFLCVANIAIILGIIGVFALVLIQHSNLSGYIEPILSHPTASKWYNYAAKYIFDIVTVGLVMSVAYKGFNTGFVGTTRLVIRRAGMLVAVIIGFMLPFFKFFDNLSVVQTIIEKLLIILPEWGKVSIILARVILGAVLAVVGIVLVALLNMLLRKLTYSIEDTKVVRVIDGALAAIVYVALGALVAILAWGVVYVCNYIGLLQIKETILNTPSFSKECFYLAKEICKYFAMTYFPELFAV